MRKVLYPGGVNCAGSVGLLLLRVVMGAAFLLHGWPKIQDPMHWMDAHGGSGMPGLLQAAAAVSEFGGGLALILGLLTPLAALGIACTMAVAVGMVHLRMGHSFVATAPGQPSYELAAVYLAAAIMFALVGPGKLSLDAFLFGCSAKLSCSNTAVYDNVGVRGREEVRSI
ncbi:MAG TPA: DoxX family protein [Gemmataceae bacterium]|nr:DoxX family protein [Gemmataceae bacterium]